MTEVIKELLRNYATDVGVYPAANNGLPRTTWQDGWNEWGLGKFVDENWDEEFKKGFLMAESEYHTNLELYHSWYSSLSVYKETVDELLEKGAVDLLIVEGKVTVTTNSSDLFAWGYADFETVEESDLEVVLKASKSGKWGVQKALCKKYNMKPQYPIIKGMAESGEWDDEMKSLPDNNYNLQVGWPNEPT